jgi:hypothetical protein
MEDDCLPLSSPVPQLSSAFAVDDQAVILNLYPLNFSNYSDIALK